MPRAIVGPFAPASYSPPVDTLLVARFYDSFGRMEQRSLVNWSSPEITMSYNWRPIDVSIAYKGYDLDAASGLYQDGNRWYDARAHVYTDQAPAAKDLNRYRYEKNDPVNSSVTTRVLGALQMVGGILETAAGVAFAIGTSWSGVGIVAGGGLALHGSDTAWAGLKTLWTGKSHDTHTTQLVAAATGSKRAGTIADISIGLIGPGLFAGAWKLGKVAPLLRGVAGMADDVARAGANVGDDVARAILRAKVLQSIEASAAARGASNFGEHLRRLAVRQQILASRAESIAARQASNFGEHLRIVNAPFNNGGVLNNANFAQRTFRQTFSAEGRFAGRTVSEVAADLRAGRLSPADVPIEYIVRDGNTLILNTRSAQALEQAGIPRSQWRVSNMTGNVDAEARLTGQLQRNNLTSQGTPTVRQSGGGN